MKSIRTFSTVIVTSFCVTVGALVSWCALSFASERHEFEKSFNGAPEHTLASPQGVAINQKSGDVFVVDKANDRVEVFTYTGAFVSAFGSEGAGDGQFMAPTEVAVDNSGSLTEGDVYVVDGGERGGANRIEVFNEKNEYLSQITQSEIEGVLSFRGEKHFGHVVGVAIDPSGNLWILAFEEGTASGTYAVVEERPQGEALKEVARLIETPAAGGFAVGANGDLWVGAGSGANHYLPTGEKIIGGKVGGGGGSETVALAANPANEDLYVELKTEVARFDTETSEQVEQIGKSGVGALVGGAGLAVKSSDEGAGDLYVADSTEKRVDLYKAIGEIKLPKEVETGPTEEVAITGVKLTGRLNPDGEPTRYYFEYGEGECSKGACIRSVKGGLTGESQQAVSVAVSGLKAGTEYHYRLVAANASGTVPASEPTPSGELKFTTKPVVVPSEVLTGPAERVEAASAVLTGRVNPGGGAKYYFEYGENPCNESAKTCGTKSAEGSLSGEAQQTVAPIGIAGLKSGTTYHYWLVAQNGAGTVPGTEGSFTTKIVPEVRSEPASETTSVAARLNGTVNTKGGGETTCQFVWGVSESFGEVAPCPEPVLAGEEPVHVLLKGLEPDITYYYRLQASNSDKILNPGEPSNTQHFTTPGSRLVGESVSDVTATSAVLQAEVGSAGGATRVYFQYGSSDEYASETSSGIAGSGEGLVEIAQTVRGLVAGTAYHYRLVRVYEPSTGGSETFYGPDHTFITQVSRSLVLPDERQWEMVTPQDKHGAQIEGVATEPLAGGGVVQAAANGGAITYLASQPTETQPEGYDNQLQAIAVRTPSGWESTDITPPHEAATTASVGSGNEYRFFSEDLSAAVVQPFGPFISEGRHALSPEEASEQTAFLRTLVERNGAGETCVPAKAMRCYRPLVTGKQPYANVPEGTIFGQLGEFVGGVSTPCPPAQLCGPVFEGATADASHVVLSSRVNLTTTTTAAPKKEYLYEWTGSKLASEQLQPVSVLPSNGGLTGGVLGYNDEDERHAISEDGSRLFWASSSGDLYIRDVAREQTLLVAKGSEEAQIEFQYASRDGSRVFYTMRVPHTLDRELYECALVEEAGSLRCETTNLTPPGRGGAEPAAVLGTVLGASEDGSWIYFAANGALESEGAPVPGAVQGNCKGPPRSSGICNLYVYHDGKTKLVAVISGVDASDWGLVESGVKPYELAQMTARVSPNGEWLAFMSLRELTGYNNHDAANGMPDEEAFVYDAADGALVCASCNPTGARPVGEEYGREGENMPLVKGEGYETWGFSTSLAAVLPTWTSYRVGVSLYQSRYLSDSGRLFFDARDALVSGDANGTWDVYEWEPSGVGSCNASAGGFTTATGGCVSLISSGASAQESAFIDASEDGSEVFFLTAGRLWPNRDFDDAYDIYDARVCTAASPCIPEPTGGLFLPCEGEACKAPATPQPSIFGAPASATFSGEGNLKPAAVAVGVVKPRSTRAQSSAVALKACRKRYAHSIERRLICERQARRRYSAKRADRRSHARKSMRVRRGGGR